MCVSLVSEHVLNLTLAPARSTRNLDPGPPRPHERSTRAMLRGVDERPNLPEGCMDEHI